MIITVLKYFLLLEGRLGWLSNTSSVKEINHFDFIIMVEFAAVTTCVEKNILKVIALLRVSLCSKGHLPNIKLFLSIGSTLL